MQVQEVQKLKRQLERDIEKLIVDFNKSTGVNITNVNHRSVEVGMVFGDIVFHTEVQVEVKL